MKSTSRGAGIYLRNYRDFILSGSRKLRVPELRNATRSLAKAVDKSFKRSTAANDKLLTKKLATRNKTRGRAVIIHNERRRLPKKTYAWFRKYSFQNQLELLFSRPQKYSFSGSSKVRVFGRRTPLFRALGFNSFRAKNFEWYSRFSKLNFVERRALFAKLSYKRPKALRLLVLPRPLAVRSKRFGLTGFGSDRLNRIQWYNHNLRHKPYNQGKRYNRR